MDETKVELAPFGGRDQSLAGFVVSGRWPASTDEWTELLSLVVRLGAVPGLVKTPTVFCTSQNRPEASEQLQDPVGLVMSIGPAVGEAAPEPGSLGDPLPYAAMLLHPPTVLDAGEPASGTMILPGLPHLGLPHRAAWVTAQADGTVIRWDSDDDVEPEKDADTAVLAMLLAA